jgi:hypothetical protein
MLSRYSSALMHCRTGYLLALIAIHTDIAAAADNVLTPQERADGWQLLFDGKSLEGWRTDRSEPSRTLVEENALNPHRCGGYMLVHQRPWSNFLLSLDFKLSPGCNSGVFFRTFSLTPRPGFDVGVNGLEVALDDTMTAGLHDTGAIYDLVPPQRNTMHPAGQWNHLNLRCDQNLIDVEVNGQHVTHMNLDEWNTPAKRPDGSAHKFDIAYKDHPREGYIGLQDHGGACWFKNIKLLPLK